MRNRSLLLTALATGIATYLCGIFFTELGGGRSRESALVSNSDARSSDLSEDTQETRFDELSAEEVESQLHFLDENAKRHGMGQLQFIKGAFFTLGNLETSKTAIRKAPTILRGISLPGLDFGDLLELAVSGVLQQSRITVTDTIDLLRGNSESDALYLKDLFTVRQRPRCKSPGRDYLRIVGERWFSFK